jgi:hypothetical protein
MKLRMTRARWLKDVWRVVLRLVELFSGVKVVLGPFAGITCPKTMTGTVCDCFSNLIEFFSRTPQDLDEANYWPRSSVAFIKCDTCRDDTIAKPVVQPGNRLFLFCAGTLRVPPNYWAERTAKHVEYVAAGKAPPNFRAKIDPQEKKRLAEEKKKISEAKRAVDKKRRADIKEAKRLREEAAELALTMPRLPVMPMQGVLPGHQGTRPPFLAGTVIPTDGSGYFRPSLGNAQYAPGGRSYNQVVQGLPGYSQGPQVGGMAVNAQRPPMFASSGIVSARPNVTAAQGIYRLM